MFGEKYIIGKTDTTMEEKRRICLPKFTYAEPGDEVVLRAFS